MPVDAGDGMVFTAGVMAGAGEIQEGLGVFLDLEAFKIPRAPGGGAGTGCDAGVVLGGGDLVLLDGEGLDGDLVLRELTEGAEGEPHHEGAALDVDERGWLEPGLGVLDRRLGLRGGLSRGGCRSSSRRAARGREDANQCDRCDPQAGA